jgi:hypothetical protein
VENGRFYGMGYIDSEVIISDLSQIKEHIMPYKTNQYIMQLIFPLHRSTQRYIFIKIIQTYIVQVLIPIKEMYILEIKLSYSILSISENLLKAAVKNY